MKACGKLKTIDYFCSISQMIYGFGQTETDIIAEIDTDFSSKETCKDNNPKSKFIHKDITDLSFEKFKNETGIKENAEESGLNTFIRLIKENRYGVDGREIYVKDYGVPQISKRFYSIIWGVKMCSNNSLNHIYSPTTK